MSLKERNLPQGFRRVSELKIEQIDDNHKTHPRIILAFSLDLSQKYWNKTSVTFTAAINQNPPTETIHNKII